MPKILELDPHVADLIAAGEVVERPASVIKELMENSIDAGASALTVEIQNGGMTYIRVTDNGCGISPADAPVAFLRHATSKLRDARGLEAIGTLGFRGEALAAISSVSRVELLTREKDAQEGTSLCLEAGKITENDIAGCPEGTTLVVRDLFFNTPARHKYMKKDSAEGSAVSSAVIKCALSHPEISVRYIKDGAEALHTPGDGKLDSCIYSVFGSEFSKGLLSVCSSDEDIAISGLATPPSASRGNRGWQFFFVNGRNIKSKLLQAALEQAYKNSLFTGKFPGCVLYISMKPSLVDVNVHPAKTEVRFLYEKKVFDAVYYAVLAALKNESSPPEMKMPEKPQPPVKTSAAEDETKQPSVSAFTGRSAVPPGGERRASRPTELHDEVLVSRGFGANLPVSSDTKLKYEPSPVFPVNFVAAVSAPETAAEMPAAHEQQKISSMPELPEYRVIGEALDTYIVAEVGSSIMLIDKHAVHERIIFDRLKSSGVEVMSQQLLVPLVITLPGEIAAILAENEEALAKIGIEVSEFGSDAVAVRRLPADMDTNEAEALLSETAEKLQCGNTVDEARDEILHSVACKAAIKAGKKSTHAELEALAAKVLSGEIKYCPHGRPVAMELTKTAIDRGFKRI